jgi:hypothetical protein
MRVSLFFKADIFFSVVEVLGAAVERERLLLLLLLLLWQQNNTGGE